MNVLSGENVDLIFPFPISEIRRTYGWNHCYRTLTESDDTPNTPEVFVPYMERIIQTVPSWGIIDKNHITNIKHEAPLVGIIVFEPSFLPNSEVIRNGFFHVATARKAWRTGLVDEAGLLVLKRLFAEIPTLNRVSAYMIEKNFPAKALCKRVGFKFEGLMEDAITKNGCEENMVLFGLTRRNYNLCLTSSEGSLELTPRLQPLVIPKMDPSQTPEPVNSTELVQTLEPISIPQL
jgi:RimJ/RimL family protein N-acetyltransferase